MTRLLYPRILCRPAAKQDRSGKIGPYAYSSDEWVGYDDAAMAARKTRWAVQQGFGGVMVWDLAQDDIK